MYNTKIIFYNDEIQISKYNYGVSVSVNHYKTEEEKKESSEDGTIDFADCEQYIRSATTDFADCNKYNQVRSLRRSMQSIYEIARSNILITSRHLLFHNHIDMIMIHARKNSLNG